MPPIYLTQAELQELIETQHLASEQESDLTADGPRFMDTIITSLSQAKITTRFTFNGAHLRPGGVVAGPILFGMLDMLGWLCSVAHLPKGSDAVTIDASVRFLRPAPAGDLLGEVTPLRVGRRMVVSSTSVSVPGDDGGPIAHAVVSFSPMFNGIEEIRARRGV